MYGEYHSTPDAEGVFRRNLYLGIGGIGRYEEESTLSVCHMFYGVFAVQLAYRDIMLCGSAFSLIPSENLAVIYAHPNHRVTVDTHEIRGFGVRA